MGGILGDHIAHQNCVKRLARYFSRDSRYLPVRLRFGIKVNKNELASLNLVSFVIVGDMEFTTANIHIIRMAEHHSLFARVTGSGKLQICIAIFGARSRVKAVILLS